jgi:hypothetical protein
MEENRSTWRLSNFWYLVVFVAGIYYGISYISGAMSAQFLILVPPMICLFTAIFASGGISRRALVGAVSLYVNYTLGFLVGYGIASVGIIRFEYR